MNIFDDFPLSNAYAVNLDWILKKIREIEKYVQDYTAVNKVAYAGVWDITKQYPQWALVTDGDTSWLALKPVPQGIPLENADYWQKLADLDPRIAGIIVQLTALEGEINRVDAAVVELSKRVYCIDSAVNVSTVNVFTDFIITRGFYDACDGGGGVYTQTMESANGIDILQSKNGLAFKLLYTGNLAQLGVMPDANETANADGIKRALAIGGRFYFNGGDYQLGSNTFEIDTSKSALSGNGCTRLYSKGITEGSFFTLVSPLDLDMYDLPRTPLTDISLIGDTFTDSATGTVSAIRFGSLPEPDETIVAPHIAINNVVVRNFAIGYNLTSAYKTSFNNCSAIACNYGIYVPSAGVQQAVPVTFTSFYAECCNFGVWGGGSGYNTLVFYGGAFEYNRSVCSALTRLMFVQTRFEFDARASCGGDKAYRNVFTQSGGNSSANFSFINCAFLGIPNYVDNVSHWVPDPYLCDGAVNSLGYFATLAVFQNCEFALDPSQIVNGNYIMTGPKIVAHDNTVAGGATKDNMFNPTNLAAESNGIV